MGVLRPERKGLEKRFFDLSCEVISPLGYEIYDLDYLKGSTTLRIFIRDPKTDSALIEDCMKVDKAMTPYLDDRDWAPDTLILEVSSPGLFRNLNTIGHFQDVLTKDISVTLMNTDSNEHLKVALKGKKKVVGTLENADESGIVLLVGGKKIDVGYEYIKKANLESNITHEMGDVV